MKKCSMSAQMMLTGFGDFTVENNFKGTLSRGKFKLMGYPIRQTLQHGKAKMREKTDRMLF
jgi:hypothetical protein